MKKETTAAVIDIGSGKICGFVAGRVEGDDFNVIAGAEVRFGVFYGGKWIDEGEVASAVSSVVRQLESRANVKLDKVYVGVPGEFVSVVTRQTDVTYSAPKKIARENINEVFSGAAEFEQPKGFSPISRSSIYFILDDGKKVIDPVGETAAKLSGLVSFIFVDDVFKNTVSKALTDCGVKEFDFVAQSLAQALYILSPSVRDGYAILVDGGFVSTSVSVVLGDGILYQKAFSVGGGQMADDLSQVLKIDYDDAVGLLSKAHLNLDFADDAVFEAGQSSVSASMTNEIIRARVEDMADSIAACVKSCPHILPDNVPVYVTGGAFCYLKGAYNTLSKCLGRAVYPAPTVSPQYDKQEYSSAYGVISIALSQSKPQKQGFFRKLLSSLGG